MTTARVTLRIENYYELYPTEITIRSANVPLPVPPEETDARSAWEYEYIHAETGAGHPDGDSWYDVEITASTAPELLGMTFQFGW
jgi:hypothetical protein